MPSRRPTDQGFNDLLEGKLVEASPNLERLRKVANALAPAEQPSPSPQFRARLRNELLAAASTSDEDVFAALLEGLPIEAPAEVGALVMVAAALEPASLPVPDPQFRFQLRNELLDIASGPRTLGTRARDRFVAINERMRRSFRVVVSTGLAAAILAGGGATVAAASSALPGDALYPVKLFRENVQLAFSSGTTEGLKRLQFARTRLNEIKGLESRGSRNSDLYIATLDRMDSLTTTGSTILIDAARTGGAGTTILKNVGGFSSVQQQDLQALLPNMPAGAIPAARDSLILLQSVTHTVNAVLSGCPCTPPSNPLIPQSGSKASPTQSVQCTCDQTNSNDPQASNNGNTGGTTGGTTTNPKQKPPQTATTSPSGPVEQLVPDVPGTNADNQITGLIDSLISKVPVPLPSISPSPLIPSGVPLPSLP
jgi:Domain of unknown function (DUF5667)